MNRPSVTKCKRLVGRGADGYGFRPTNDWGSGDLPAPFAIGDLLYVPEGADFERLRSYHDDFAPGFVVVYAAYSIDYGDAWYFRVTDGPHSEGGIRSSDRLHVASAARSSWDEDCNWLADMTLVETADPDGLAERERLLADGWSFQDGPRCECCGRMRSEQDADIDWDQDESHEDR